ncbi:MAG: hypothetical protein ACI9N9_002948, partial [Enterobacterales bacterium]
FITMLIRLLQPSGIKAVAAENLTLKKQLLVIQRSRSKAPNLQSILFKFFTYSLENLESLGVCLGGANLVAYFLC